MKVLCVYYSRTGNTKKVAEEIVSALKCDTEQIVDKTDRRGIVGWIFAGRDGMNKSLTEVDAIKHRIAEYDLVILGSPLWVNLPPAMRTFITKHRQELKKVAFFCTMGGSEYRKLFDEMETLSNLKPVATMAIRDKEVGKGDYKSKIVEFVKRIQY